MNEALFNVGFDEGRPLAKICWLADKKKQKTKKTNKIVEK